MAAQEQPDELQGMPAKMVWHKLNPASGEVTVPQASYYPLGGQRRAGRGLSDSSRMALALTDACCELGYGKVFPTPLICGASSVLSSVDEQSRWTNTKPFDRLKNLTARYGAIPKTMSVLPIDIELFGAAEAPRLNGLKTGTVTVMMLPVPYVGLTKEMRKACEPLDEDTLEYRASEGWHDFQPWRSSNGLVGIAMELKKFYVRGDIDFLFYGSLQKRLCRAGRQAAQGGQAYFRPPKAEEDGE
ncbi:uncharacterized protein Z520_02922 [Fonsecaea multimorphosa CBS 102226]|uniref:Uncharacterized protein n=1 Tax=Fonsecaea multimorphosa CBS 102226 TaxID=1442371 RepID=A0A0D2KDP5_9EURO|nr:uncharacterized protein Z520_02922 [Fonsecaea multimorphosa CBS 102226]KIY01370.1 hypothetical protein Z520_02922 [Fonsecaea multimorphosa CBS 102226]